MSEDAVDSAARRATHVMKRSALTRIPFFREALRTGGQCSAGMLSRARHCFARSYGWSVSRAKSTIDGQRSISSANDNGWFIPSTVHEVLCVCKRRDALCTALCGTRRAMSLHDRLRRARSLKFSTSTEAAAAYGFNPNTLRSNENGNKSFGREMAVRYAKAFGVRLEWLLDGRGSMRANRQQIPVEGYVGAGAVVVPFSDGGFDPVEPPFGAPDGAVAFIVRGDSMYPAFREGTYLIALACPPEECEGKRAIVTLDDDHRYVKFVSRGSRKGLFSLHSHNGAPINDVRVMHAARIIGTVEP